MTTPNWAALKTRYPATWVESFERSSDRGTDVNRTTQSLSQMSLPPSDSERYPDKVATARALLEELAALAWLTKATSWECPICGHELTEDEAASDLCTNPDDSHLFTDQGAAGATEIATYARQEIRRRQNDWMVLLHGMNTRAPWQQRISWLSAVSTGRSIPVEIYKYGVVRPGVLSRRRHASLVDDLVAKLKHAQTEVTPVAGDAVPDIIAHSFGTMLLGKALHANPTLRVGRIVTLGCIQRPDFNWATLFERGQVEAVLNNFGTKDGWVKMSHFGIPDAGPAGRRGFDLHRDKWPEALRDKAHHRVINVAAAGFSHSEFFDDSTKRGKFVTDSNPQSVLEHQLRNVWMPFLTTSSLEHVEERLNRHDQTVVTPASLWKPKRWPLRALVGGWKDSAESY